MNSTQFLYFSLRHNFTLSIIIIFFKMKNFKLNWQKQRKTTQNPLSLSLFLHLKKSFCRPSFLYSSTSPPLHTRRLWINFIFSSFHFFFLFLFSGNPFLDLHFYCVLTLAIFACFWSQKGFFSVFVFATFGAFWVLCTRFQKIITSWFGV